MANTYLTGNPLGSTAAKDLFDNSSNFDEGLNSELPWFIDRMQKRRQTWSGMEVLFSSAQTARQATFETFLDASGYVWIGDYSAGLTFTRRTQYTIRENVAYRPASGMALPFTTTGNWANDQGKFVAFDADAVLAQDLANTIDTTKGVSLIGGATRNVDNLSALKAVNTGKNKQVFRRGFATPGDGGEAFYYFDGASTAVSDDITVVAPNNGAGRWILNHPGYLNARIAGCARNRGDNQVPLNACLAIAGASERLKRVHLPADTYSMNDQVVITGSGVTLTGDGRLATVLFQSKLNTNILNVQGPHFTFSGLGIYYSDVPTAGANVLVTNTSCNGRDFVLANAWNGIDVGAGATACKFTDFDITNYEQSAFYMHENGDCFISNFLMNAGNTNRGRLGAIRLYNHCEAFIAEQGDILLGRYSLVCDADSNVSGDRPAFNKFTDVYFDSAGLGCYIDKTVETDFNNCWFSGGKPQEGGAAPGMTLLETINISVTGGQAFNCGSDGIYVSAKARNTYIGGGFKATSNSATAGDGVGHGINLAPNATTVTIGGVMCRNGLHPGKQGYGVFLGTGVTQSTVLACQLMGNQTGAIGGDFTGAGLAIAMNKGFVTTNKGFATVPVGQSAVSVNHGLDYTPDPLDISVTPASNLKLSGLTGFFLVPGSITSTQFQIATNEVVATNVANFVWQATTRLH